MTHAPANPGRRLRSGKLADLDTGGSYTPALTAVTTDPDLGADGEAVGAWHRSGHLITGWARFLFSGAGLDPGSGTFRISLPFDADVATLEASPTAGLGSPLGSGAARDDSNVLSNSRLVQPSLETAEVVRLLILDGTDGTVAHDQPFTWAEGDRITITLAYVADPSSLPSGGGGRNRPGSCRPQRCRPVFRPVRHVGRCRS